MGLSLYDERKAFAAFGTITVADGYNPVAIVAVSEVDRRVDSLVALLNAAATVIAGVGLNGGLIPVCAVAVAPNVPPDMAPTDLMAALRAAGISELVIPAGMTLTVAMPCPLETGEALLVTALGGTL